MIKKIHETIPEANLLSSRNYNCTCNKVIVICQEKEGKEGGRSLSDLVNYQISDEILFPISPKEG